MLLRISEEVDPEVAAIVRDLSDSLVDTSAGAAKEDWEVRKTRYLDDLAHKPRKTLEVSLADKVQNAESILADCDELGEALWSRYGRHVRRRRTWATARHSTPTSATGRHRATASSASRRSTRSRSARPSTNGTSTARSQKRAAGSPIPSLLASGCGARRRTSCGARSCSAHPGRPPPTWRGPRSSSARRTTTAPATPSMPSVPSSSTRTGCDSSASSASWARATRSAALSPRSALASPSATSIPTGPITRNGVALGEADPWPSLDRRQSQV